MMEAALTRNSAGAVRRINRARILSEIRRVPGISRRQLAGATGLTDATVSRIARALLEEGLIDEATAMRSDAKRGRPHVGLRLRRDGMFVLAVCLSAYEQRCTVVDSTGRRLFDRRIPKAAMSDPAAAIAFVSQQILPPNAPAPFDRGRLLGASVSVAGAVDGRTGNILAAPLIGRSASPFGPDLGRTLDLPVVVDNVANVIHVAEAAFGERGPVRDSLLVHGAVGFGASLRVNGVLSRGAGDEGAVNNILVDEPGSGSQRPKRLSQLASGETILHELGLLNGPPDRRLAGAPVRRRLLEAVEMANSGNAQAIATFAAAGAQLGKALGAIAAIVRPERVILAGPLAQATSFARSFRDAFHGSAGGSHSKPAIQISETSYHRATELMGLEEFLFSERAGLMIS